jgi:hypothetical protein
LAGWHAITRPKRLEALVDALRQGGSDGILAADDPSGIDDEDGGQCMTWYFLTMGTVPGSPSCHGGQVIRSSWIAWSAAGIYARTEV